MIVVILGLILLWIFFLSEELYPSFYNVSKYESTVTTISNSVIQFLNDKGLNIPKDQISKLIQSVKILEFTGSAVMGLFKMLGNAFLIFLVILFILMEFGSFSIKAKAITSGTDKSIAFFTTILKIFVITLG